MMRFPLLLTWDLTKALIAQKLFAASARHPFVLRVDLAEIPAPTEIDPARSGDTLSTNSSRDLQALALVRASAAPVVWISGDMPLHYPRVGQIARDIVNHGRTVFIEMDGTLLRRRIHEFRPVSRLYLVLPLNGLQHAHDLRTGRAGNFRATIESIRTAKLSGFHVCVETTIFADTETSELRKLAEFNSNLDVDGWIHKWPDGVDAAQVPDEKMEAARHLISSRGWRSFSEQLDLTRSTDALRYEEGKAMTQVEDRVHAREERVGVL